MLIFWPWAQANPIINPLHAFVEFSHFPYFLPTLFAGSLVSPHGLPRAYLPTYVALALPELILALLICAPILAVLALWRSRFQSRREEFLARFLVGFGIIFPIACAIALRAVLYNGMRHFIFVLPLIAVAAALVTDHVLDWLARFPYRRP